LEQSEIFVEEVQKTSQNYAGKNCGIKETPHIHITPILGLDLKYQSIDCRFRNQKTKRLR